MTDVKICDWCEKAIGQRHDDFVYRLQTSLTYCNSRNKSTKEKEPEPRPISDVEICESCYHKQIKPVFGWRRDIIIVPEARTIGRALQKINDKFNEEWDKHESTIEFEAHLVDDLKKIDVEFDPDAKHKVRNK